MDQQTLDRACAELRSRRDSLGDPAIEMLRLKNSGYGVIGSIYVIWKAFEIPLRECKELASTCESAENRARLAALPDTGDKHVQS